jgi:hypothetical protein
MATVKTEIPVGAVSADGMHKLMLMRDFTFRFGMLNETQVMNLKAWPSCFLGKGVYPEITYKHEERAVEYNLFDMSTKGLNLSEGAVMLDKSTKFLLGVDVRVTILSCGQAIYNGGPQEESWLSQISPSKTRPRSKPGKKTAKKGRVSRRR